MSMVTFYGYGYRNNCFGVYLFYEDETIFSAERGELILKKSLQKMKREPSFSIKVVSDDGEQLAISTTQEDAENGLFTVLYSKSYYNISGERKINSRAVLKAYRALTTKAGDPAFKETVENVLKIL